MHDRLLERQDKLQLADLVSAARRRRSVISLGRRVSRHSGQAPQSSRRKRIQPRERT
jgi:hypothetical protein